MVKASGIITLLMKFVVRVIIDCIRFRRFILIVSIASFSLMLMA